MMPRKEPFLNTDTTNSHRLRVLTSKLDDEATNLEKMFTAFMAVSCAPKCITDGTRIVYVNKAFEEYVGYSSQSIVGSDFLFLVTEEHKKIAKEILKNSNEYVFLVDIVKKNGAKVSIELHSHAIPYKDKTCMLNSIKEQS